MVLHTAHLLNCGRVHQKLKSSAVCKHSSNWFASYSADDAEWYGSLANAQNYFTLPRTQPNGSLLILFRSDEQVEM